MRDDHFSLQDATVFVEEVLDKFLQWGSIKHPSFCGDACDQSEWEPILPNLIGRERLPFFREGFDHVLFITNLEKTHCTGIDGSSGDPGDDIIFKLGFVL